uniref:ATP-dependent zinc metalloprotease FTSH 1 n=1 Tax=Ulva pseudorotundata TaxID=523339 RepID=A0A7L9K286_9CHLO|nr:ATP-dependent zinc metalloprotease FTSH 1 [Ulva rigida]QOK35614.1 ATP-dependent zinc metalloprotease FTSH 1 [Ulva rigida]
MKQKNKKNLVSYNKNKHIYKNQKFKVLQLLKQLSIIYNLLIFSKKRFKKDFTNFPSNLFFIILLPLLGYTLDKQKFLSNNINNFESFFYKTLPGLNTFNKLNLSNLTWETFNYTEYFKKINWNNLKQLSYFDSSVFISFNSNLHNNKFYISANPTNKIELNINNINIDKNKNLNKYFISGRKFNILFKPDFFNETYFLSLNKKHKKNNLNNFIIKNNYLQNKYFLNLKNWQHSFYELDNIPLKLNSIFYSCTNDNNVNIKKNNSNYLSFSNRKNQKYLTQPLFNNLFYYKKLNLIKKTNLIKKNNVKTVIEKKNNILNFELGNKKLTYDIYNFRFFHYKIYNKLFLFKKFLKYQINDFYNNKSSNSFSDFIITKTYSVNKQTKNILLNNNKFISILKNKQEPNWKNLIRKDLKNLGSTKNDNFIYYNTILKNNINLNNNLNNLEEKLPSFLKNKPIFFFKQHIVENNKILKNKIKTPISIESRENKNTIIKKKNYFINKINDKNIKYSSLKIKNKQSNFLYFGSYLTKIPINKKYSFLYYFEREFFYYLEFLMKTNKSNIKTHFYNDNMLCFLFNNKKDYLLKNKISESDSSLLKRKVSGYLYPDVQKKNIIFINQLDLLFNNSFIQIKGPKNLIYNKFKNFSNNLFFLYSKKSSISFNLEEVNLNKKNNLYVKNKKNLTKNINFFGNQKMDFGLGFSYNKNKNLETMEIDKSNYQPNLSLIYSKQRLDSKSPFSWQYPIKEDLLLNNNNYFHSLLVHKKNNYNLKKNLQLKIDYYDNNNNYLLEVCDFNEIPLVPISYKSYFKYNKNYNNFNSYYSNFIKNFNNLFNTDLYELVSLKQWSLLTQISFLLIFLTFINNLKETYGESFLTAFKTFFNNFEFDALINLKIEVGKTIKSKKIKFNNLVGGKFFLQEFNQTILLLRNSKFGIQSNFNIKKPDFNFNKSLFNEKNFVLYSQNKNYKNSFILFNIEQKNSLLNFINNPFEFLYPKYKKLNSKKKFTIKNLQNKIYIKGFLLVGPPGTGKTVLVKALSGEAEVPIVLESGEKLSKFSSSNDTISENAKGALELKNLFKRAKKISPCILFLDEIDSVGQNRKDVLVDYRKKILLNSSTTNSYYFLSNNKININSINFNKSDYKINNNLSFNKFNNYIKNNDYLDLKTNSNNSQLNSKSLSMLTQLLCELDGLKDRCDLVIIGATNRPKTLDPALTRPGRLSKIVYIDLPGKKKRFELLKFYSKNKKENINWEFFANQTTGLSAADLSSSLNISLLKTIYNYINLKKNNSKLVTNFNIKNKLIPGFEEIEYGIQIIKFRNNSFKYKSYELGILINSLMINYNYFNQIKLISLFDFSKFILNYKKFNFIKDTSIEKNWLNLKIKQDKISPLKQISRTIFYKKNRKFIRSLYLLNKKTNITKLIINKKEKQYFINKFNKYINRVFKVNIFSSRILLLSTYIINNPLTLSFNLFYNYSKTILYYKLYYFNKKIYKSNINTDLVFDKNFITFKYNNLLKYKIINYNFKLTNNIVLISNKKFYYKNNKIFSLNKTLNNELIEKKFNNIKKNLSTENYFTLYNKVSLKKQTKIQQLIFSDSSFINRISYYIGGKALILTILKKPISNVNTLNLWSIKNNLNPKIKKKLFIENSIKKLINKEDFENYLFFIINGKISEIKMLLDTNSKNFSNFAIDDLKELSWLLNIMINKNDFYKTLKSNLLKKVLIQTSKSSFKKNNKQIIKNNYDKKQLYLLINKFDQSFLLNKKIFNLNSQNFNFWSVIPYWWEPNLKLQHTNIMYWSFKKSKKVNFLTLLLKQSSQYYYLSNNSNNNSNHFLISNNYINYDNNRFINSNKINNYNFINKFFEFGINWNNLQIIEYYILISNLIFNLTFNCFNLLELNVEFVDYLIYYILCNERFYDFELNKLSLKYYYFKNN